ncbi:N-acetyltransferase family protein [Aerococcus sanguinicola]|uniref:N-acetyltransferase n=1 Tax=Aerococcus sanguinicola TaxID=119206 RepID=A0A0X8F9W7_9LACT|nr:MULTISPECIES: N-acetyltransferase [Aerococcus]AMB93304.1 hypothetical protein AWM72_00220 [Aerococcus sanguinicola]MDK7049685.1 N-acetyltransferase [Aerococcus sanguinicola]OFT95937.1 hypothetical protein HMPREF3090_03700 [Aerococcus sp. HMSC23C02]PKZ23090.1 N-acetyltransferase [Aerococcus sanguinicola]
MPLEIRPYQAADFDAVKAMIQETWYPDVTAEDPDLAARLADIDAKMRLEMGTFALVADYDAETLGIFIGDVQGADKLQAPLDWEAYLKELGIQDKTVLEVLDREREANACLDRGHQEAYQGVLQLFILSARSRGKGIGGKLWRAGLEAFRDHGVDDFILHTDSDCDVSFYDYKGLVADAPFSFDDKDAFQYFLYHGKTR